MRRDGIKVMMVIGFTLIFGLSLSILPLPNWAVWLQPEWMVLILLYWVIALPHRIGLSIAWFLGLLLDALNGSVLGAHAFALVLLSYFMIKMHRQMRVFPLVQQAIVIFFIIFSYELILLFISIMLEGVTYVPWFWVPAVMSMLLWPWLFILLRDCRHCFSIE